MTHRKTLTFYCWLCALTALAMAAAMVGQSSTSFAAEISPVTKSDAAAPAAKKLPELLKEDFENGHIPNLFEEHGGKSELQFNKAGLARKVLTGAAIVTFAVLFINMRSRD